MDIFLKRLIPPQGETLAGPLGGVPGNDSSMRVIIAEDLPVEQDVEVEDGDNPDSM